MKNKVDLLCEIYPVIKSIDEKNNSIIAHTAIFKTLSAGEKISSGKSACNGIMFILKGNINIQRINEDGEETYLYNIRKGELCHEAFSCLLNYKSLNIVGTAMEESYICIIPMDIVRRYLMTDTEFLVYVYRDIYEKFRRTIEKREYKNHKSLEERIVRYLSSKNSKVIYITHKELADEVDSSREVVSRKLKEIEKLGYIQLERGKIKILKGLPS